MRCKQGDIAIVTSVPDHRVAHHLGMIVTCKSLVYKHGVPCWKIDPVKDDRFYPGAILEGIADSDLTPLRGDLSRDTIEDVFPHSHSSSTDRTTAF